MTSDAIAALERRDAAARGTTREQDIAAAVERYRVQAERDGLVVPSARPWPPEGEEREDFDRSTREAIGP